MTAIVQGRWGQVSQGRPGVVRESLHEVAVLVAVFGPLDTIVQGKVSTLRAWISILVIVGSMFLVGVFLEVKSRFGALWLARREERRRPEDSR